MLPYRFRKADGEALAGLPRLRVVQTMTAGVEHVRGYVPDGVLLCNGRGIHDTSAAELAVALTLASLRNVPRWVRAQDRAEWKPKWAESLADKRVLIVGYGQIGEAIEARMLPFEAEVVRVARSRARRRARDRRPAGAVARGRRGGADRARHRGDHRPLRRRDAGPDEGRRAAGQRLARPGRRHRRPARRAARRVGSAPPSTWSTRSRCPHEHPLWQAPGLLLSPHVGGASSAMWPRAHRLVREQLQRYAAGEELANVMTGEY